MNNTTLIIPRTSGARQATYMTETTEF